MDISILMKNLEVPQGIIDVVLDTDAYNEVDDQYAISYMLKSKEKLNVCGLYAAPFFNENSSSPKDGMERSYEEILKLLELAGENEIDVFKGSVGYLENEKVPQPSPAAEDLSKRAMFYSPERPLYVVAIGAITNIASAILMNPAIIDNIVVVWLGGHATAFPNTKEFNMFQDIAAARVIFGCGVPLVQLPCLGVVSEFAISKPELEYWLVGKNPLSDYLAKCTINAAEKYAGGKPWTRVIWDVTAVAWLLNDNDRFMLSTVEHSPIPEYDFKYGYDSTRHFMRYVYHINRDALMDDLIRKLTE